MPIAICGVSEVPAYANTPLDHIVSIRDSRQPGPNLSGFKSNYALHSFVFDDTCNVKSASSPSRANMKRLLDIYATTRFDQNVLFHCFAGVSRSSAAAFIWLVYHGVLWNYAYQTIVDTRGPFVCPNQLMVKYADEIMGCNGALHAFLVAELGRRAKEREEWFEKNQ